MQVFEKLDNRCSALIQVAGMTEQLQKKLNRTEERPEKEDAGARQDLQDLSQKNIIELFDWIADTMAVQIDIIGNNTDESMNMID